MEQDRLIKPKDFDIALVVSTLNKTYKSIEEVLEQLYQIDIEALNQEDIDFIDSQIFLCIKCLQWNDISNQEDEGVCSDCYENEVDHIDDNGEYKEDEEDE